MHRKLALALGAGLAYGSMAHAATFTVNNTASTNASADAIAGNYCDTNAAAAIPVLEKHLKAGKVPLPPRT